MDLVFWVAFLVLISVFLALDLGVFHKSAHVVPPRESLGWTAVWVSLAILACVSLVLMVLTTIYFKRVEPAFAKVL